jgi:hypothetical protein
MRRVTALLTSLFLLHLILVGADLTCTKHGAQTAGAVAHTEMSSHEGDVGHANHHGPVQPAGSRHADDRSCEIPTLPACCQALASCGVTIAGNSSADASDLSHLAAGVVGVADGAPASWTLEPDPPPPKA